MNRAVVNHRTISESGAAAIMQHEGFRAHLYNDTAGHCTIGYGHLVHLGRCNGTEPTEFRAGITRTQAGQLFLRQLVGFEAAVNRLVTVPLSQNQFDALVSFVYNVGVGNFASSTLLRRLNSEHADEVPGELMRWNRSGGRVTPGLVNRRHDEAELFHRSDTPSPDTRTETSTHPLARKRMDGHESAHTIAESLRARQDDDVIGHRVPMRQRPLGIGPAVAQFAQEVSQHVLALRSIHMGLTADLAMQSGAGAPSFAVQHPGISRALQRTGTVFSTAGTVADHAGHAAKILTWTGRFFSTAASAAVVATRFMAKYGAQLTIGSSVLTLLNLGIGQITENDPKVQATREKDETDTREFFAKHLHYRLSAVTPRMRHVSDFAEATSAALTIAGLAFPLAAFPLGAAAAGFKAISLLANFPEKVAQPIYKIVHGIMHGAHWMGEKTHQGAHWMAARSMQAWNWAKGVGRRAGHWMAGRQAAVGETHDTSSPISGGPSAAISADVHTRYLHNAGRESAQAMQGQMQADADVIRENLQRMWIREPHQREMLAFVEKWANIDEGYGKREGTDQTPNLDLFFLILKTHSFRRRSLRSMGIEEQASLCDGLFYYLDGERLTTFKTLLARSKTQRANAPDIEQQENTWKYIGKAEAMATIGITKGLSIGLTKIADLALTEAQNTANSGLTLVGSKTRLTQHIALTEYVKSNYDETAKILGDAMGYKSENYAKILGMDSYQLSGLVSEHVLGNLMVMGAGSAVGEIGMIKKAKTVLEVKHLAEDTLKFGGDYQKLVDRVAEIQKEQPEASRSEILKDDEVLISLVDMFIDAASLAVTGTAKLPSKSALKLAIKTAKTSLEFVKAGIDTTAHAKTLVDRISTMYGENQTWEQIITDSTTLSELLGFVGSASVMVSKGDQAAADYGRRQRFSGSLQMGAQGRVLRDAHAARQWERAGSLLSAGGAIAPVLPAGFDLASRVKEKYDSGAGLSDYTHDAGLADQTREVGESLKKTWDKGKETGEVYGKNTFDTPEAPKKHGKRRRIFDNFVRVGKLDYAEYRNQHILAEPTADEASSSASPVLQRSGTGDHPEVDAGWLRADLLRRGGGGTAPDSGLRDSLSGHLGFDPGGARLHSGPIAAAAARQLNAEAFTIGRDVFFGAGRFDPATSKGRGLLAHELTHVGQQTGTSGDDTRFFTQSGGDDMEREAQQAAGQVMVKAGSRGGLFVEDYVRYYESDGGDGLTQTDKQRLDHISLLALQEAERLCKGTEARTTQMESVNIEVDLDISRLSDSEAAQIWAEAIFAAVKMEPRTHTSSATKPHSLQRYEIQGPWDKNEPVHETITQEALKKASLLKEDGKYTDPSIWEYIRGVIWNDDPQGQLFHNDEKKTDHYTTGWDWWRLFSKSGDAAAKGKFFGPKDPLLSRSHYGDLQFLHGMASQDGEAPKVTRDHMMIWAEFTYKVAVGAISENTLIGDVNITGFGELFPDKAQLTVRQFFAIGLTGNAKQRAMGSLSHMIEDSFASGHTQRELLGKNKGRIISFHSYTHQDHKKHGHDDEFGKGETDADKIANTSGASDAVTNVAEVMRMMQVPMSWEYVKAFLKNNTFAMVEADKRLPAGPGNPYIQDSPKDGSGPKTPEEIKARQVQSQVVNAPPAANGFTPEQIAAMSGSKKLLEAAKRFSLGPLIEGALGVLAVWAALHFTGIGEGIDAAVLAYLAVIVGITAAYQFLKCMYKYLVGAWTAKVDTDLTQAGKALSEAVGILGAVAFGAFLGWLSKAPGLRGSGDEPPPTKPKPNTASSNEPKPKTQPVQDKAIYKIQEGQQGKHIPGHNNFKPEIGKSVLEVPAEDLLPKVGTGEPVNSVPRGQPGFKERVDFGRRIGIYTNPRNGVSIPTNKGIVHYGKGGVHIVPSAP